MIHVVLLWLGVAVSARAGEGAPAATDLAANDPAAAFGAANTALAAADLPAAEAGYRAILASGVQDPDVYYNLGNVLYRQDRLSLAILAWRRAALLAPRDPDPLANLDFARRRIQDKLDAETPRPWFAPWQVALTASEAEWLGGWAVGLGLLGIALRSRAPGAPLVGGGVAIAALGLVVGAGGIAQEAMPPCAVVTADAVTATSDLGGGVDLFTLHTGTEVETEQESAGKVLIRLSDGRRGWVDAAAVGLVDVEEPFPVL